MAGRSARRAAWSVVGGTASSIAAMAPLTLQPTQAELATLPHLLEAMANIGAIAR
ncbi:hypothetical protein [Hydrogenophaga sp.]|uniref:hypothetical protein n=1 Tax=Hydrogenophaga sp. TaxID=1904254 RepID=UPI002721C9FF|nr:hypothetical protein [Hydrogenophaga sp.]MDO9438329.1 hypothetical protein [Hydrogenophaga sp.]